MAFLVFQTAISNVFKVIDQIMYSHLIIRVRLMNFNEYYTDKFFIDFFYI